MHCVRETLAIAGVFCVACGIAAAQYETTDKSILGIGYSFTRPSGSQLRNIKSIWTGPILDVNFLHDDIGRPVGFCSIGWFGETGNNGRATFVPLRVSYIKRLRRGGGTSWYVGGGLAAYFANYKGLEYSPFTRDYQYVTENGVLAGANLLGGIEFGGVWYGELRYDLTSGLKLDTGTRVSFSGLSLVVGSRHAF